jgi:hypothetical protein
MGFTLDECLSWCQNNKPPINPQTNRKFTASEQRNIISQCLNFYLDGLLDSNHVKGLFDPGVRKEEIVCKNRWQVAEDLYGKPLRITCNTCYGTKTLHVLHLGPNETIRHHQDINQCSLCGVDITTKYICYKCTLMSRKSR